MISQAVSQWPTTFLVTILASLLVYANLLLRDHVLPVPIHQNPESGNHERRQCHQEQQRREHYWVLHYSPNGLVGAVVDKSVGSPLEYLVYYVGDGAEDRHVVEDY